jgi:hypothetical protein
MEQLTTEQQAFFNNKTDRPGRRIAAGAVKSSACLDVSNQTWVTIPRSNAYFLRMVPLEGERFMSQKRALGELL